MSDSIWSDGGRIQMPQYEKLTRIKRRREWNVCFLREAG